VPIAGTSWHVLSPSAWTVNRGFAGLLDLLPTMLTVTGKKKDEAVLTSNLPSNSFHLLRRPLP
jgi:hypothetical protein